jgi:hypothetical protein
MEQLLDLIPSAIAWHGWAEPSIRRLVPYTACPALALAPRSTARTLRTPYTMMKNVRGPRPSPVALSIYRSTIDPLSIAMSIFTGSTLSATYHKVQSGLGAVLGRAHVRTRAACDYTRRQPQQSATAAAGAGTRGAT